LIDVTNGNALIHEANEITGTSYTLPTGIITQDAQYTWKVKALNTENDTETPYASRNFYVDTTAPNVPLNTTPLNNAELPVNDEVDFIWTVASDNGPVTSSISYSIQIAQDLNFATIINAGNSNNPAYQYTFTLAGTYYWRIRAVDQAGNVSSYSAPYKITIE
jgi:predicted phage tail protein